MKNLLKRFTHKFIIDDKGAVSIYLIIITLLLFLFNAVLIDFARILVAERQTEEAARTALRSTMSSYNKALQDKGLFAFEGDAGKANQLFKSVFTENIKAGEDGAFNLVGLSPVDSEITTNLDMGRSLANESILTYQILEEMKYKAPVEVGEALIESFLSISSVVEQASDFSKVAADVNGKAKEREEKLDEAIKYLEEAKNTLEGIRPKITGEENSIYPAVNNIKDIMTNKNTYRKHYKNDEIDDEDEDDETKEQNNKDQEQAEEFKANAKFLIETLIEQVKLADASLVVALVFIKDAETLNNEVIDIINDPSSGNTDYDDAKNISDQAGDGESMLDALDDYILDEVVFTDVIAAVEAAIYKIDANNIRSDTLLPKLKKDFLAEIEANFGASFFKRVNDTRTYYQDILGHITSAIDMLEEERAEYKENQEEIDAEEEKGDDALEENKDLMDEIEDAIEAGKGVGSDNSKYADLSSKAANYGNAIAENALNFEMTDKDKTADDAMSFIDTLFKEIGSLLVSGRDKVYVNEYILLRFKSHNFKLNGVTANSFENNQVEYIIYGFNTHGANYFAALSEIFAVRFGINLAAAFLKPENKVFGPFFWVAALADALAQTAVDMSRLTAGERIDLFPRVKGVKFKVMPTMDYKDHLRLFLFAHAKGARFERLMAVLDDGTGADLVEKTTYITGQATASIKLWFLPQVAEVLGRSNIINGRVEGNKFIIEKEVHYSY